jgi:hypothetical protein
VKNRFTAKDLQTFITRGLAASAALAGVAVERSRVRPRARGMNRLEARYAQVLELRRRAGDILWYDYEVLKFKLAPRTYFTPDFPVLTVLGLELHEVKGHWEDDARVKIKVAAQLFPFSFLAVQWCGETWQTETFQQHRDL